MPTSLEDQRFVYRCQHCATETHLDGRGGILNCKCRAPHGHTNFDVQALTPGRLEAGRWYAMKDLLDV